MKMSHLVLVILVVATTCFGIDNNWYYISNATDAERNSALSSGCFHGSYGPISLLSCNLPNALLLGTLSYTTHLCAVQTSHLEDFALTEAPLLQIDDWYLLTSELGYSCLDENVGRSMKVTVSPTPWKAPEENSFINATQVNSEIVKMLESVNEGRIYQEIVTLSNIHTRQAQSTGAKQAQSYLVDTFKKYGFTTSTHFFRDTYSDNVIAEIRGTTNPNEIVIIGSHYDCRSTSVSSTTQRAPGADDNASGTATNLEFARVVSELGIKFRRTIRILAFSGEEQGLVGSRAYAALIKQRGDNVVAMFNGDMLGWFPNRNGVPITLGMVTGQYVNSQLLASANSITKQYLPNLRIGSTTACCSDQQSFIENGYPAISYFESDLLYSSYPAYHTSQDLPDLLNQKQLGEIGRAIMAATLTYAQAYLGQE